MQSNLTRTSSCLRAILGLLLLLGACSSSDNDPRRGDDMLAAVCYYDDGLRLALEPDAPDGSYCVGANVVWTSLNNLQFSLVRARPGETVPVSHPSYVHPSTGRRYIFIPLEHVPRGTKVWYEVSAAGGRIREQHGLLLENPPIAEDMKSLSKTPR